MKTLPLSILLTILAICLQPLFLLSHENNQTVRILLADLQEESNDITRVLIYERLADYYISHRVDSAMLFIDAGLKLSKEIGYKAGQAEMYATRGDLLVTKDRLIEAMQDYELARDLLIEANEPEHLAGVYLVLGNIHWVQDNHAAALEYYIMGENLADSLKQTALVSDFHNNLGTAYMNMEEYEQSLKYYTSAIELFQQSGNFNPVPVSMINMATVYIHLKRYNEAREMCLNVLRITDSLPETILPRILAYLEYGDLEYAQENFEEALINFSHALELTQDLPMDFMGPRTVNRAALLLKTGYTYYHLGNYESALESLKEAYTLGLSTGLPSVVQDASIKLSQLYDLWEDNKTALEYLKIYVRYSDSISDAQTAKKITQVKMRYEFDKTLQVKELERLSQVEVQKRKELILLIVIGSIFAGLILLFLLLRLQRNKTRRIELEQENLKMDLDYKNKELTTNVMYLLQKNEFIMKISEKLTKLRIRMKVENRDVIDEVIREIEGGSKEVNWKDFELRFQEVHSDFYKKINLRYPDLSPNELKLCAFLRLNMTTKEISSITFQSYNSIIMARHRLRKKLDIDSADNLVTFLQGF